MTAAPSEDAGFGPGHPEWCPKASEDDPGHCGHWYDCEPCHRCGDDTPDPGCDCPRCSAVRQHRHVPSIKGLPGSKCAVCGDGFLAGIHVLRDDTGKVVPWPVGGAS